MRSIPPALLIGLLAFTAATPVLANDHWPAPVRALADQGLEIHAEVWERLERSHWILDGAPEAPRVVYTFTDPNCPYCRQFWEAARPWVEAGEVQLRHIMVGILAQDSPAKASALLGADDPATALHEHKSGTSIAPSAQPREIEEQVYTNNQLFEELGLIATPTTVARDGQRLVRVQGMPDDEQLVELMGSEAP